MKIFRYWWFFALVAIAVYLLFFRMGNGTMSRTERAFAISDTAAITKIIMASGSQSVALERVGNQWLSQQNSSISHKVMATFLVALSRIETGAPVPSAVADSIISTIYSAGTQVKLYSGSRVIRSFRVMATSMLDMGTIGLVDGAKRPFALRVAGSKGVAADFFIANPSFWRGNTLAPFNGEPVAKVDVDVIRNPELSFSVVTQPNIALRNLYHNTAVAPFDTMAVKRFLKALADITLERFEFETDAQTVAAVKLSEPEHMLNAQTTDGRMVTIRTYPIPVDEYLDEFGRPVKFDLDRIYVSVNADSTLYIVRYVAIHPILKDLSAFIPK